MVGDRPKFSVATSTQAIGGSEKEPLLDTLHIDMQQSLNVL
jgi:hypothetical protein